MNLNQVRPLGRSLRRFGCPLALSCVFLPGAPVDTSETAAMELELMSLLNTPITVASRISQTQDRAPSIISVLKGKDIEALGARDISDILRQVPGFEFGVDLSSTYGLGFRGIWAHEGKALIMINGQAINDLGFGNFSFFGSIPAAMIERVEIIRGPGSALYGGFAEVAVINVITRSATDKPGGRFNVSASTLGSGQNGGALEVSANAPLPGGGGIFAEFGTMSGYTSRGMWQDYQNTTLELGADNSRRVWDHMIMHYNWKDLNIRYLQIRQSRMGQDGFYMVVPPVKGMWQEKNFNQVRNIQASQAFQFTDKLKLDVLLEHIDSTPINEAEYGSALRGNSTSTGAQLGRDRGELVTTFASSQSVNLIFGGGYYSDSAQNIRRDGNPGLRVYAETNLNETYVFRRNDSARYLLAQYTHSIGDFGITVGGRQEFTSYGNATAPRAGFTWSHGKGYAKVLYGEAFRIPLIWQTYRRGYVNPAKMEPETSKSFEIEGGYRFTDELFGRMNAFQMDISKPIVFLTTGYVNYGEIHSQGLEGELQYRRPNLAGSFTCSYAKPTGKTSPGFLNQGEDRFLGLAQLKMALSITIKVGPLSITPSASHLGERDAQNRLSGLAAINAGENAAFIDDPAYPVPLLSEKLSAVTLFDLSLKYNIKKDLDLFLKGHNLSGAEYKMIQPYYGGHAPIRANDKEITLEAQWRF